MLGYVQDHDGFVTKNSFARYNPMFQGYSIFLCLCSKSGCKFRNRQSIRPLLRVINVDTESKSKVVETIYTQEFHHKVLLKQIPEIHVQILSDTSRPIEFNWEIVLLHYTLDVLYSDSEHQNVIRSI